MWVFLRSYGLQNSKEFLKEKNGKKRKEKEKKNDYCIKPFNTNSSKLRTWEVWAG